MKINLALVLGGLGLLGCGAQQLQPGAGSKDAGRRAIDATERNLDDAGCPPEGKIACLPVGCSDVFPTPACIHGVWSCPALAVGISCPVDASDGTDGGPDAGARVVEDASTSCPPLSADGGRSTCGCGSDTVSPPRCVAGAWTCPPGASGLQVCPPCSNELPPPPGCMCNPTNGAVTCAHDAGADAPSD